MKGCQSRNDVGRLY